MTRSFAFAFHSFLHAIIHILFIHHFKILAIETLTINSYRVQALSHSEAKLNWRSSDKPQSSR
jgi:hypothetical protein